jgi:hypothetical protein
MTTPAFKIVSLSTPSAFEAKQKANPRQCDTLILPLNTSLGNTIVYGGNLAYSTTNFPPLNLAGICKVVLPNYGTASGIDLQYRIQNVTGLAPGQIVTFINNNTGGTKHFTFDLTTHQNNIIYAPTLPVNTGTIVIPNAPVVGILATESLVGVNVTNGGSGYTSVPSVLFTGGTGTFSAVAVLTGTVVTKVYMTAYGTVAPTSVSFSGGGGLGVTATIVLVRSMSVNGLSM